jgi:hypothetical protein
MTSTRKSWVTFVVAYRDGVKQYIEIDSLALERGDDAPSKIARQWQEDGKLRLGKIAKVYRL